MERREKELRRLHHHLPHFLCNNALPKQLNDKKIPPVRFQKRLRPLYPQPRAPRPRANLSLHLGTALTSRERAACHLLDTPQSTSSLETPSPVTQAWSRLLPRLHTYIIPPITWPRTSIRFCFIMRRDSCLRLELRRFPRAEFRGEICD